ncbi:MAG: phosphate regulon transcriptional regulator PhoB [Sphingomonadales bacterium]|nr:phosphate regulon transcriptional regulator PhoB [Sphingomonadales bacterium]
MKPRLLIVEDDASLAELLSWTAEAEGYAVQVTGDGEEALLLVREQAPDLILLDWMIDNVPGIEVCRQLRRAPETREIPIIMLTARGEEEDKVRGLKTGADDYVTKPFSPRELMARVETLLRRSRPSAGGNTLVFADLELDPASHKVRRAGQSIHLGPTEYRLLMHFMERPTRVHSRDQLLDAVWGMDKTIDLRTVDVHIRRLRKAINIPGTRDLIRTVRSAGYALDQQG